MTVILPLLIGGLYVLLSSLIPDRHRRPFNAIVVAGAGAAYLSGGGLGAWALGFTAAATWVAYPGLAPWTFSGIAWLMHTAWDVVHHLKVYPIIPFAGDSSFGCAICDPAIAIWCFAGGRPVLGMLLPGRLRAS